MKEKSITVPPAYQSATTPFPAGYHRDITGRHPLSPFMMRSRVSHRSETCDFSSNPSLPPGNIPLRGPVLSLAAPPKVRRLCCGRATRTTAAVAWHIPFRGTVSWPSHFTRAVSSGSITDSPSPSCSSPPLVMTRNGSAQADPHLRLLRPRTIHTAYTGRG